MSAPTCIEAFLQAVTYTYTMSVGVGKPATQYNLFIDTGGFCTRRPQWNDLNVVYGELEHLGWRKHKQANEHQPSATILATLSQVRTLPMSYVGTGLLCRPQNISCGAGIMSGKECLYSLLFA